MGNYKVKLLPAAYSNLDEIFDYIMVDNPGAALRVYVYRILHRARNYGHLLKAKHFTSLKKFFPFSVYYN